MCGIYTHTLEPSDNYSRGYQIVCKLMNNILRRTEEHLPSDVKGTPLQVLKDDDRITYGYVVHAPALKHPDLLHLDEVGRDLHLTLSVRVQ